LKTKKVEQIAAMVGQLAVQGSGGMLMAGSSQDGGQLVGD